MYYGKADNSHIIAMDECSLASSMDDGRVSRRRRSSNSSSSSSSGNSSSSSSQSKISDSGKQSCLSIPLSVVISKRVIFSCLGT